MAVLAGQMRRVCDKCGLILAPLEPGKTGDQCPRRVIQPSVWREGMVELQCRGLLIMKELT